jgi:hypothetical protein
MSDYYNKKEELKLMLKVFKDDFEEISKFNVHQDDFIDYEVETIRRAIMDIENKLD